MNPRIMQIHLNAFEEEQRCEAERRNVDAWVAGQYVVDAVAAVFGKHHRYPKEPYPFGEQKEPTQEELRDKIRAGFERKRASQINEIIRVPTE